MQVSIIAIGDELLIGQVVDTNSGMISREINPDGWSVRSVRVVADDADEIKRAIKQAFDETDVVLTTGGLGPTKDDITKPTLCELFGGELVYDKAVEANVLEVVRKRGLKINSLTAAQAYVPSSCRVIQNRVGTAPLMWTARCSSRCPECRLRPKRCFARRCSRCSSTAFRAKTHCSTAHLS